jgi:hypothetical protein
MAGMAFEYISSKLKVQRKDSSTLLEEKPSKSDLENLFENFL